MKQRIINFLFRKLLNAVVIEDVLVVDKGLLYIGGKLVSDEKLRSLIAEAKALQGFELWKIINGTLQQDALDRGWNKSTSIDDLNTGKTIYYTLDMQKSIINLIRSKEKR